VGGLVYGPCALNEVGEGVAVELDDGEASLGSGGVRLYRESVLGFSAVADVTSNGKRKLHAAGEENEQEEG
jgi:hypothetical protein